MKVIYSKETDDLSLCFSLSLRHLGLDLVPRKEFEMVDEDQISVSDLYKMVRPCFVQEVILAEVML